MTSNKMNSLAREVQRFRRWADEQPRDFGEWETEYSEWPALWAAAEEAIAGDRLSNEDVELLIYALARDNECETILGELQRHPTTGMRVARVGIECSEPDARWQLAVFLGSHDGEEPRLLLRRLVSDPNEYVRRRALLASAPHDPSFAEQIAAVWLTSEHEYSRIAALTVLRELRSERLHHAVELLRLDASPHVRERVREIADDLASGC
jgi:hypothetical protein